MTVDYLTLKRLVCYLEECDFPSDGEIHIFDSFRGNNNFYRLDFYAKSDLFNKHFFKDYQIEEGKEVE